MDGWLLCCYLLFEDDEHNNMREIGIADGSEFRVEEEVLKAILHCN